jgi:hypothetical protein
MHCLVTVLFYVVTLSLSGKSELLEPDDLGTIIKNFRSHSCPGCNNGQEFIMLWCPEWLDFSFFLLFLFLFFLSHSHRKFKFCDFLMCSHNT